MISSTAILACSDVEATIAHYKDVLGFESSWTWGEPPSFGSASMGGVSIMFALQPEIAAHVDGHQHWIQVANADELYRAHRARGAHVVSEIEEKPWNVREYVVRDLNGYHLRFAGPVSVPPASSQPFPEGVTVEARKPTAGEFAEVAAAEFSYKEPVPGLLEATWGGVVAKSPDGETIGVLRIMQDAPGWFSIWDVAVKEAWQARHIGSAMMREALKLIHDARPGAFVYLFTFKHGFYERLGFAEEKVSMRRL